MRGYVRKRVRGSLVKAMPVLLMLLLSACAGSGHRLPTVSSEDLLQVNKEIAANKYVFKTFDRGNAANRALVSRAANRLLDHARPLCDYTGYKSCFFQIGYSSGDTVNAFAADNYKITVYRGLVQYLQSEDEVAAVIAHEMGHHLANHNQEQKQNAMVGAAISGLLTAAVLGAANRNGSYYDAQEQKTVEDMTNFGAGLGSVSYSREEEGEADLLGEYLLVRSGYSLKKAERVIWLLLNMQSAEGDSRDRAEFGDTHPAGPERLVAWRKTAEEIRNNRSKLPYKAEKATP